MTPRLIIPGVLLALACTAPADPAPTTRGADLLRFTDKANNDTLHGKFVSFGDSGSVIFKSTEAAEPTTFSTEKLHRITLGMGKAEKALAPSSTVTLVNGDIIPGKLVSADGKHIVLDTEHLGQLDIATDAVAAVSPTPHGGKLLYYGPMNADGWKTVPAAKEEDDESGGTDWKFVAGAWYAGTDKGRFLVRENALPDTCKVKFKVAWRGSLYCNIGIHSDLSPPEKDDGNGGSSSNAAAALGKSYMVNLSSHSVSLYQCTFDEKGNPRTDRVGQSQAGTGLSGQSEADIELRIDRPNKNLILYVNGMFKVKWDLGENYFAPGKALAFKTQRYNNSEMRVSDILITRWNGMRDSAGSMQSDARDVVLLTNGLDRFSGSFRHIKDGQVAFRGTFDNDLSIPLGSVQEIRFASGNLRKAPDPEKGGGVSFFLQPFGRISGTPSAGENGRTKLHSAIVGHVSLDMRFVNIIDFSRKNNLLEFWDENF